MRGSEATSSLRDTPIWLGSSASSLFCAASAGNATCAELPPADGAMRKACDAFAAVSAGFETPSTAAAHAMKDAHARIAATQVLSMMPLSLREPKAYRSRRAPDGGYFICDFVT